MAAKKSMRDEISDLWEKGGYTPPQVKKTVPGSGSETDGMMGYDQSLYNKVMSDPALIDAGAEMAGLMDDRIALGLMADANDYDVPNGGSLGWTEALSKGIDKGLGTYNLLNAQRVKANALRAMSMKDGAGMGSASGAMNPDVAQAFPVNMRNPVAKPL
jgi:hypothetical protein